jgi:hypothetical protein
LLMPMLVYVETMQAATGWNCLPVQPFLRVGSFSVERISRDKRHVQIVQPFVGLIHSPEHTLGACCKARRTIECALKLLLSALDQPG